MANIIDGLGKAPQRQLVELAAVYKTYNPLIMAKVALKKFVNFFKKLFKREYVQVSMPFEYDNIYKKLSDEDEDHLLNIIRKQMAKALRDIYLLVKGGSDDRLSVCSLNAVSRLYRNKDYPLMSPAEKADKLKRQCGHRNPNTVKRLPYIWLASAILLFIIDIVLMFVIDISPIIILLIGLLVEVLTWFFFRRRLSFEKLAKTVSLSGRSLGEMFVVSLDELSIRKTMKNDASRFERGLRVLHSLNADRNATDDRIKELEESKKESERQKEQINADLRNSRRGGSNDTMDQAERKHYIMEWEAERERVQEEIRQCDVTIEELDKKNRVTVELADQLSRVLENDISRGWTRIYDDVFDFEPVFFIKLVQNFAWHDFELIEKRLIEIKNTEDPTAIGEYKAGSYYLPFGINGRLCRLVYKVTGVKNNKRVKIYSLERNSIVSDIGMSEKEIEDGLKEYGIRKPGEAVGNNGEIARTPTGEAIVIVE